MVFDGLNLRGPPKKRKKKMKSRSLIVGLVAFLLVVGIASAAYIEYYGIISGTAKVEAPSYVVGWWSFDGSGTTAEDVSTYGNDGVLYDNLTSCSGGDCPTRVEEPDGTGKVLKLDGSNDHVKVPDSEHFDTQNITWEAWIKSEEDPNGIGRLISRDNGDNYWQFKVFKEKIRVMIAPNSSNNNWQRLNSNSEINSGWNHVAATYDGNLKFYINGSLDRKVEINVDLNEGKEPIFIGSKTPDGEYDGKYFEPFDGSIDNVKIYDRTLSHKEIENSFQSSCEKYNAC